MGEQPKKDKQAKNGEAFNFSHIGVTMTLSVLIGVMLGNYLDDLLGTSPWLLLIFSLLGVGAAFKTLSNIWKGKK